MSASINLLQTINFPKNIKELNSILPESNYKKFNTENKKDRNNIRGKRESFRRKNTKNKRIECKI